MGHRRGELTAVSFFTVVAMPGLVGCGSDDDSSGGGGAQATSAPQTTAAPATTGVTTGQQSEPAQLADGRHPVILKQVSTGGRRVTFDLIQWFVGDAAAKAAAEDGQESPPPNDYYTRNVNPRLRTLPVTGGDRITLTRQTTGQGGGNAAGPVPADLATVAASGIGHIFWATVRGGQIQALEEQYVP
ncbi:MAG TPA: hypothetical protein VJ966_14465 [Actinomycetes bacterium]|nr:hypothetical protein [Actinomycetes bacterium]